MGNLARLRLRIQTVVKVAQSVLMYLPESGQGFRNLNFSINVRPFTEIPMTYRKQSTWGWVSLLRLYVGPLGRSTLGLEIL